MPEELVFGNNQKYKDLGVMIKEDYGRGEIRVKVAFENPVLPFKILSNEVAESASGSIPLGELVLNLMA